MVEKTVGTVDLEMVIFNRLCKDLVEIYLKHLNKQMLTRCVAESRLNLRQLKIHTSMSAQND